MSVSRYPKISIVTPSFNQVSFLEKTIRSVLDQGYPNLEFIIIDGGSTDGSVEVIRRYESRLAYWVTEPDEGHSHALSKGFSHATGEIMAWINSDDMYTPWAFGVVAEVFVRFPHVKWITGFNSKWNRHGAMTEAARNLKNIYDFLLGNYGWIQQESVFWHRELWEKAGGTLSNDYRFMVDGELWSRFFLHERLYALDCILGGYRAHSSNRSKHNHRECQQEMDQIVAGMRGQCSAQVLRNLKKIQMLPRFSNRAIMVAISRFWKLLFPAVSRDAAYDNIAWEKESWVERKLPFVLPPLP